jgi:hypothetical protein
MDGPRVERALRTAKPAKITFQGSWFTAEPWDREEIIVTMAAHDQAPRRANLLLIISAVVTLGTLGVYASVVYDNSPEGIASMLGGIFVYLVISLLVGFAINKLRFSRNLVSTCLLISTGMFWVNDSSLFIEALDARESKSLMAQAKSWNDIIRISKEHPKNRLLAVIGDLMAVRVEGEKKSTEILAPLVAYDYSCAEKVTQRNRQALVGCRDYFVSMIGTISDVKERYASYTALRNEKLKKLLPDLSKRYHFSNAGVMRGLEQGVTEGMRNAEYISKQTLSSLETLNKACVDWFSFLVPHFDDYEFTDEKLLWKTSDLLARYNSLYNKVGLAASAVIAARMNAQAYDEQRFDKLTK